MSLFERLEILVQKKCPPGFHKNKKTGKCERIKMTVRPRTEEREVNPDGTISCGVFIPLPFDIARDFPDKSHEDDSVPHLTMLYAGDLSVTDYENLVSTVAKVVRLYEPFRIDLKQYGEFHNPEGQLIPHMIPRALDMRMNVGILNLVPSSLATMHEDIRKACENAGLTVAHRYGPEADPEAPYRQNFKAHATLDYVPAGSTYDGPHPKGSWMVTELECWGHEKYRLPLGVTQADQPGRPKLAEDKMPGGKGDKLKSADVSAVELKTGIKHELEHTKDKEIAKEIALDHLAEDPKYYSKLEKAFHEALEFVQEGEWEGIVTISEDDVVEYPEELEELERVVPCPKGQRRRKGACKPIMTQVAGPGVRRRKRPGPQRVVRRPHPGPVRVSDVDVDDAVVEVSDFPFKYGGVAAPSNRTGIGTAPISDERPEQEKKDALKAALKKRGAKVKPRG
jgi:2'-5' RNA ligase